MLIACFCIALITLIATGIALYYARRRFNRAVQVMLIGIICVITVLIFPMYNSSYGAVTSILFSMLYALSALTGGQSVEVSHMVPIEGWLHYGYYALLYIAFITAPVFTTGFLVSILGNLTDKIRYRIMPGKVLHIFSELNEGSVLLCESIESKNAGFVFCNTRLTSKDKDSELVKRARAKNAIILDRSELDIKLRRRKASFYQISKSKDYNANTTLALIEKYRSEPTKEIRIATFSTGITTELLLDSIDKGQVRVKLLDEVKYSCYALLDHAPLFEGITKNKISALIVGCDYMGTEMLKSILWCGQLEDVELEVNVIDKAADDRKKRFMLQCPDISLDEHRIKFIQADVKSVDFEAALTRHCNDTNYVVVATGDDKINIDTAVYLRKFFLKQDRTRFTNMPRIYLRVRDALRNKQMDALCDANIKSYELYAFGSIEKTFSISNVLGTEMEAMAVGVHLAYYNLLNGTKEQREEAMKAYYCREYNQRSSFATALHFKYKLYSCGVGGLSGRPLTREQADEFERMLKEPDVLERMAVLEHRRWNMFMQTEGYTRAAPDDVRVYYALGDKPSHVHHLAKLHPTLVGWDELDTLNKELLKFIDKPLNFKQSDYDIMRKIPDIIRAAH